MVKHEPDLAGQLFSTPSRTDRALGAPVRLARVLRETLQDEFLHDVVDGGSPDGEGSVHKRQVYRLAVFGRVIQVRDGTGGEMTNDTRVIRLRASVVPTAHDRSRKRIANAG
jgi:hypothetical protein